MRKIEDYRDIQEESTDFMMKLVNEAYDFIDELANEVDNYELYGQASRDIESIEHTEDNRLVIFWKDGGQNYVEDLTPDEILDIVRDLMGFFD